MGMAVALDGDDADALLWLVIMRSRGDADDLLDPEEARGVLEVVGQVQPDHPLLPAARAWSAVGAGEPDLARQALGSEPGTWAAAWARLQVEPPGAPSLLAAADAVLAVWPDHAEACAVASRARLRLGDLAAAEGVAERCRSSGAGGPEVLRVVAKVADRTGRHERARALYQEAGMLLHSAEIAVQDGMTPTTAEAEAQGTSNLPGALLAVQAALIAGDAAAVQLALQRLEEHRSGPPEVALSRAACLVWLGHRDRAAVALEGLDGTRVDLLRVQIAAADGDRATVTAALARLDADWPAHHAARELAHAVGGAVSDGPVVAVLGLGPGDRGLPAWLLGRAGRRAGQPLGHRPKAEPNAAAALDTALSVVDGTTEVARAIQSARDSVVEDGDAARALTILSELQRLHPELVGLAAERYRVARLVPVSSQAL
jgi:hypothetical protein